MRLLQGDTVHEMAIRMSVRTYGESWKTVKTGRKYWQNNQTPIAASKLCSRKKERWEDSNTKTTETGRNTAEQTSTWTQAQNHVVEETPTLVHLKTKSHQN